MSEPSTASKLGAVVLALASFGAGCRPKSSPIDLERAVSTTPVYTPTAAEVSDQISAARPQHQQLLEEVVHAEKLLQVYHDHFAVLYDSKTNSYRGYISWDQLDGLQSELEKINLSIDSHLHRKDSQLTERQSIALLEASKSLFVVRNLMKDGGLQAGDYGGDSTWASNLDVLYRAQAELTAARWYLEGAIQSIK